MSSAIILLEQGLELNNFKFETENLLDSVTKQLADKDKTIQSLDNRVDNLEAEKRRLNLVLAGIAEPPGETKAGLAKAVQDILNDLLGWPGKISQSQVFRMGAQTPRKIVIKLLDADSKTEILRNAYKLKPSNLFISEDFTVKQDKARFFLRQFIKEHPEAKFISNFMVQLHSDKYIYDKSKNKVT